ncbi:MAG: hypothetical protein BMS9Abin09_0123 [Gammaproteobacteria bacterium]|nr:MAG: hypothetical protein BMS9Abin09_0123 [Gammaproteobacteria bacterium]
MMGGNGDMVFGGVFMWIFWILLIIVIIAIVKAATGRGSSPGRPADESPMEILRKRYARGEIDEQEFERRRRELEQ